MKKLEKITSFIASLLIITIPDFALAQTKSNVRPINKIFEEGLIPAPTGANQTYEIADIFTLLGNVLTLIFTFTAVIAIIYVIIGGYNYVTAYGNPENIQKGKQTITWAILGLIVSIASFAIVQFVWTAIGKGAPPAP